MTHLANPWWLAGFLGSLSVCWYLLRRQEAHRRRQAREEFTTGTIVATGLMEDGTRWVDIRTAAGEIKRVNIWRRRQQP